MPRLSAVTAALIFSVVIFASCAPQAGQGTLASPSPTGVQATLDRAADLEGVPRPLLAAIAWIDSRASMNQGMPSDDSAYGLLHLIDRPDLAADDPQSLARAARLTGLSADALRTDAFANARGGAALLRAEMDKLLAEYPDLREDRLGDWFQAVMRISGTNNPKVADGYASQAYRLLREGLGSTAGDGTPFEIAPQDFDLRGRAVFGELALDMAGQYCPGGACVAFVPAASTNYSTGRGVPVTMIVIHDMEGSYSASISWFQNPVSLVSAHYMIRSSDGQITQMVLDEDTAWHAGNHDINHAAIGIEHEGFAHAGAQWYTEAMYQSSAALVRWLSDTYSIPKDRTHIIGHYEVPDPFQAGLYGGADAHHDPCDTWAGTPTWHNISACYWDWTHYMALITGSTAVGTGQLTGFVGDNCCGISAATRKPLVGAAVELVGTTLIATTDSTGTYSFTLPAGNYTPRATLTGYQPGDHTSIGVGYAAVIPVLANQTSWGSILLSASVPAPRAPVVTITQPVDGTAVSSTPVTVRGTLDDVSVTSVTIGGKSFSASGGSFAGKAGLNPGANAIVVSASNAAGAGSATVNVSYAPPSTGVSGGVAGPAGAVANAAIALSPGGAHALSDSAGNYLIDAAPGSYTLTCDAIGFVKLTQPVTVPADRVLRVDLVVAVNPAPTAPRVRIDSPLDGARVSTATTIVSGVVVMPNLVSLNVSGESAAFDSQGSFSVEVRLQPGSNTISVVALDKAGHTAQSSVAVEYDPAAAQAATGCTHAAGLAPWGLIALFALLRRRRASGSLTDPGARTLADRAAGL